MGWQTRATCLHRRVDHSVDGGASVYSRWRIVDALKEVSLVCSPDQNIGETQLRKECTALLAAACTDVFLHTRMSLCQLVTLQVPRLVSCPSDGERVEIGLWRSCGSIE